MEIFWKGQTLFQDSLEKRRKNSLYAVSIYKPEYVIHDMYYMYKVI